MADKLVIDVYANRDARGGEAFITTDSFGRFRMSAGLVDMLSARGTAIKLYAGFDKANKRIALGKPDVVRPTDAKPLVFDRTRHYANARGFYDKYGIPREVARYVYDGNYEGWMMFKREDYTPPDGRASD